MIPTVGLHNVICSDHHAVHCTIRAHLSRTPQVVPLGREGRNVAQRTQRSYGGPKGPNHTTTILDTNNESTSPATIHPFDIYFVADWETRTNQNLHVRRGNSVTETSGLPSMVQNAITCCCSLSNCFFSFSSQTISIRVVLSGRNNHQP
jgi:hypothetical protein